MSADIATGVLVLVLASPPTHRLRRREPPRHRHHPPRQRDRLPELDPRAPRLRPQPLLEPREQRVEPGREQGVVDLGQRALERHVQRIRERIERQHVRHPLLTHLRVKCTHPNARLVAGRDHVAIAKEPLAPRRTELVPHARRAFDTRERRFGDRKLDHLRGRADLDLDGLPVPLGRRRRRCARRGSGRACSGPRTTFGRSCAQDATETSKPSTTSVPPKGRTINGPIIPG